MSADVHFSTQKQVKTKKKVIKSADAHFFCPNTSEDQKKSSRPQAVVCAVAYNFPKFFRGRMV